MWYKTCVSLLGSLLLFASASASVTVSWNETPPTNDVLLAVTPNGTDPSEFAWNGNSLGQSYYAAQATRLDSVSFRIETTLPEAQNKAITVKVFEITDKDEPLSSDNLKWTLNGTLPGDLASDVAITFSPAEPLQLTAGRHYVFILENSELADSVVVFPMSNRNTPIKDESYAYYKLAGETDYHRYENRSFSVDFQGQLVPESRTAAPTQPAAGIALFGWRKHQINTR